MRESVKLVLCFLACLAIVESAVFGSWLDSVSSSGPPINRFFASSTSYQNTIVVHGGATVFDLIKGISETWNDTWQYFPATNSWKEIITPTTPIPRHLHSAAVFQDKMYIFGGAAGKIALDGNDTNLNDMIALDLKTSTWSTITPLSPTAARKGHSAAIFQDTMLIFGGWFDNRNEFFMNSNISIYNFTSNSWSDIVSSGSDITNFFLGRSFHSVIVSEAKKKLYIFGGTLVRFQNFKLVVDKATCVQPNSTDIVEFSLDTHQWRFLNSKNPPPAPLCWQAWQEREKDNSVVLISFEQSGSRSFLNRVFNYSFITNTWAEELSTPPATGRIMGIVGTVPSSESVFFDDSFQKSTHFTTFIWSGVFADPAKFLQNPDTFNAYLNGVALPPIAPPSNLAVGLGVGIPLALLGVAAGGVGGFFLYRRRKARSSLLAYSGDVSSPESGSATKRQPKNYRISKNEYLTDITFLSTIGSGHFGVVYKGIWNEGTAVACKELADNTIVEEAKILSTLFHKNIVQYYGIYKDAKEKLYLCMEFMDQGSLDRYIKTHANLSTKRMLEIACDATNGMIFLSDKNIIHRDLALRNIFVSGETDVTVKIGDFGMSRVMTDQIYKSQQKEVPVRWTALEALEEGVFSVKSDIWAFGIVLWELFSIASLPYSNMSNQECYKQVKAGYRLPKPSGECPKDLHELMLWCWKEKPEERPTFHNIQESILKLIAAEN